MKNLTFIPLLFLSFLSKAEMGTMTKCLAHFQLKDGTEMEAYLHLRADVFINSAHTERMFDNKLGFLHFLKDSISIDDDTIYKSLQEISCPKSNDLIQFYAVYSKNKIPLNFKLIKSISCIDYEVIPFQSHVENLSDTEIDLLSEVNCQCVNFDLDLEIQDLGGDAIPTYFLASCTKDKINLKAEISAAKTAYRKFIGNSDYREKKRRFFQYKTSLKQKLLTKDILLFENY